MSRVPLAVPAASASRQSTGLRTGDAAIGVEGPFLVVPAVAVPDDDRGAVGGALPAGVQALVAVHPQFLGGGRRPLLELAAPA